jgi:ADP-dependent NAD(P)H-hydrate dehydratase / NAD(P)H-hydrate epimerase
MLRHYVGPVAQGVGIFMVAVLVLAIPYLIWQYRRHGTIAPRRAWAHLTFALYLICAWALVLLPLPDPASLRHPAPVNLVPFQWWSDMMSTLAASDGGWRALLTNAPLLIRVFNVALTLPLGVYLRRWFRRGLVVTTLAGFGLSLAFELTQVTALWGLYPMPYRQFDVDDLIANTTGAALGWVLAPAIVLLPRRRHQDDLRVAGLPSPLRRLLALAVDVVCWVIAYLVCLLGVASVISGTDYSPTVLAVTVWTITFLLVFVGVPLLASGATLGRALLGLSVETASGGQAQWWRFLVREVLLMWPAAVAPVASWWVHDNVPDTPGATLFTALAIPSGWLVVVGLVALLRRDRRSLPDLVAGTRVVVTQGAAD